MARLITRCISKKPVHCEQSMPLESVVVVVGWGDNPPTAEARIAQGINTYEDARLERHHSHPARRRGGGGGGGGGGRGGGGGEGRAGANGGGWLWRLGRADFGA